MHGLGPVILDPVPAECCPPKRFELVSNVVTAFDYNP